MTKLALKTQSLSPALRNEVLLVLVNMFKIVKLHSCGGERSDSAVRLTQCIRLMVGNCGSPLAENHLAAAELMKAEWASKHGRGQLSKVLELASQNAEWALGAEVEVEEKSVGPDECIMFRQLRERKGGGPAAGAIDDEDDFRAAR